MNGTTYTQSGTYNNAFNIFNPNNKSVSFPGTNYGPCLISHVNYEPLDQLSISSNVKIDDDDKLGRIISSDHQERFALMIANDINP